MKPTFKTTALAILVSLGAVACSSTSSGEHPLSKQSIQDNNKSEAEQKRLEEEAKIKAEEAQKAKDLEEEAKLKAEEAQKAKDLEEKARLEREAKERAEEAKRLEEAHIQAELNKIPKTTGNMILNIHSSVIDSFWEDPLWNRDLRSGDYGGGINVIPKGAEKGTDIDIKEAIKDDIQKGGKYSGLHKGSYKSTTGLDYPKVIELDDKSFEHGSKKLIIKKADYNNKDVNYLFINNPYSSYGALFIDRHSSNVFTESFTDQDSNFKAGYYIKDGVEYNMESLQGKTFAYKGNIIAVAKRAIPNTAVTVDDEPTVDGDIAFKIKFTEKADSNEFSDFVINSKLLGNGIKLKRFESCSDSSDSCDFYSSNDFINGSIGLELNIVDKDANDVVGFIDTIFYREKKNGLYSDKLPENGLVEYKGVFGATKQ